MREIRPSGSEGGVRSIPHPYPYRTADAPGAVAGCARLMNRSGFHGLRFYLPEGVGVKARFGRAVSSVKS